MRFRMQVAIFISKYLFTFMLTKIIKMFKFVNFIVAAKNTAHIFQTFFDTSDFYNSTILIYFELAGEHLKFPENFLLLYSYTFGLI